MINNRVEHHMRQVSRQSAISIHCDTSLADVIKALDEYQLSGAPVVNQNNQVIGFISEYDCLKAILKSSYHCDEPAIAKDVMSKAVVTVRPNDSVVDLAIAMLDKKPEIYPVTENSELVGLITRQDVLHALQQNQALCNRQ
ncbi:CBS domain-containing protein [Litoribacillus peritrichatus]|uniref:CBS domain-containing protein n=1 Tax=Litoribacillus peritrichatus TaxID=718191 RepID=A0ABP7MQM7_9GAMM